MKRIGILIACGALTLALSACDDDRDGDTDGGITLMDSGPGDEDSGTTPTPDSGPEEPDAGPRECGEDLTPFPLEPRCSDETRSCVDACATAGGDLNACVVGCLEADDTEPADIGGQVIACDGCIGYVQQHCIQENGGEALLDALTCCIQDNSCTTQACIQTNCAAELGELNSAANPAASTCFIIPSSGPYDVCYLPPPA